VAPDRLAACHAFFAARFLTKPGWIGDWLQVFSKAEDSVLSLLDPVLYIVASLEFSHGPLERRCSF
jgi:hypothetical protein